MTFDEYVQRKKAIKREASAKRRALDAEWLEAGGDPFEEHASFVATKEHTIFAETVDAIRRYPKGQPFDINGIITAVEVANPERVPLNPTTISGALRKLAMIGWIKLAK